VWKAPLRATPACGRQVEQDPAYMMGNRRVNAKQIVTFEELLMSQVVEEEAIIGRSLLSGYL
jgi:hypothetical protein